jgi:Phytochelatin synthase
MHRKQFPWAGLVVLLLAGSLVGTGALYVRQSKVPPTAIASSVLRAPELMERAWHLPVSSTFQQTIDWQTNGSRCGPAAIANTFRSLGERAATEDQVLDGTGLCWTGVCIGGLTLDELAELVRAKTNRKVTVLRDLTEAQFRAHMRRSNDPARRYIVNFDRRPVFGAGAGHHSPIGGYLDDEDLVFVLDVNADYRPWLIETSRLFRAVDTRDGELTRGLLLIE